MRRFVSFFILTIIISCMILPSFSLITIGKDAGTITFTNDDLDNSVLTKDRVESKLSNLGVRSSSDTFRVEFDIDSAFKIGEKAFFNMSGLVGIVFNDTLTTIGESAFEGCVKLTALNFEVLKLSVISARAFYGCTALTYLYMPPTITDIGTEAFALCTGLKLLDISGYGRDLKIYRKAFYGCSSLTGSTGEVGFIISERIKMIDAYAFTGTSLLGLSIKDYLTFYIDPNAFVDIVITSEVEIVFDIDEGGEYTDIPIIWDVTEIIPYDKIENNEKRLSYKYDGYNAIIWTRPDKKNLEASYDFKSTYIMSPNDIYVTGKVVHKYVLEETMPMWLQLTIVFGSAAILAGLVFIIWASVERHKIAKQNVPKMPKKKGITSGN